MNRELRIILAKYFTIVALTIVYVVIMITFVGPLINQAVFGQTVENNIKAPPPVVPTPVPNPTPTSPNPNLQYLPQKAYVQAYAPENGIPATSGQLQVVPQVVPAPAPQQQSGLGIPGVDIAGILALGGVAVNYFRTHMLGKTTQNLAETNVKQAVIQQKTLEQVYENMPDKGESIKDKPEIQLREVADVKAEAVKTASKA